MDSAFHREEEFQDTQRGKFPKEWKIRRFNRLLSLEYGKGLPEQKRMLGMYPVVGSNGVIGYHSRALVRGPGIVIGRKGTIGAVTWIDSDFWPIDTTYYVKVTSSDVDLKWLFYELVHLNLSKLSLADVVPGLKRELANNLVIPHPPLSEQRAIVGVLGVVDLAVAKAGEIIAKTERLKKGLMQTLLTRGIGHKEYKQTPIGTIPKEWEVVSIYDVKANMKGAIVSGPFGSNIGKRFFVKKGVPLIRGNNLTKGERFFVDEGFVFITEEKAEELQSYTAFPGDLIFTAAGTLGQVGLIPENCRYPKYVISNKQLRARVDTQKAFPLFLFYWFSTSIVNRLIKSKQTGTSIPVINLSILRSLPIPLPTIDEQQRIAEILLAVDKKLELERGEKAKLERVKQGLMDLLLTGKIRVKVSQD